MPGESKLIGKYQKGSHEWKNLDPGKIKYICLGGTMISAVILSICIVIQHTGKQTIIL